MKLVESSVKSLQYLREDGVRLIEYAGKVCYHSDRVPEDEKAWDFFQRLVDSGHHSVLEHVRFLVSSPTPNPEKENDTQKGYNRVMSSVCNGFFYKSANLRTINERKLNNTASAIWFEKDNRYIYSKDVEAHFSKYLKYRPHLRSFDLKHFPELSPDNVFNKEFALCHFPFTYHIVCDRAVSHELVRHREASFSQESTRYCNYSKDRFNNEITCVAPVRSEDWSTKARQEFIDSCDRSEQSYFNLLKEGITPQEARGVLPTFLKTEIVMTMTGKQWMEFFRKRYFQETGKVSPEMLRVATTLHTLFHEDFRGCTGLSLGE